jgi:hypothetical protein
MMSEELAFDDEKQATNAPQMPWRLEYHPRSGGEMIPWVIGTDGMQRCATAEEVQVWEYIQQLRESHKTVSVACVEYLAKNKELTAEVERLTESAKAKRSK